MIFGCKDEENACCSWHNYEVTISLKSNWLAVQLDSVDGCKQANESVQYICPHCYKIRQGMLKWRIFVFKFHNVDAFKTLKTKQYTWCLLKKKFTRCFVSMKPIDPLLQLFLHGSTYLFIKRNNKMSRMIAMWEYENDGKHGTIFSYPFA